MSTYSQLYIQVIFAVKNRQALIKTEWEDRLFQYITGIVQSKGQKMIAINGVSNHIHIFIGLKPSCCISDLVREIKKSSSIFIKENHLTPYKFQWQEGYGVFSYSHSHIDRVAKYVMNQKEHHRKKTFKEEYIEMLHKMNIDYKEEYLFDFLE
ncbi:MAG: IS200/IS605 family transposase [Bacteroidetes bacterium]|nr:MAG: IS200/IS605 family transposase [Bacteroidota bacterium]MBL1143886.1 IS200/IS605 family transposase [Bacteroidota bacterium]NOG56687.1 IS200/IS605 family transposase [Bacteroidota bacterium]